MEALELAQGLGVVGAGVDGLHAQLSKAAFELDLDPVQAPGEAQSIVGQDLARQAVARGRELEAVPGCLGGRSFAGKGREQVTGVVVDHVHHPDLVP